MLACSEGIISGSLQLFTLLPESSPLLTGKHSTANQSRDVAMWCRQGSLCRWLLRFETARLILDLDIARVRN